MTPQDMNANAERAAARRAAIDYAARASRQAGDNVAARAVLDAWHQLLAYADTVADAVDALTVRVDAIERVQSDEGMSSAVALADLAHASRHAGEAARLLSSPGDGHATPAALHALSRAVSALVDMAHTLASPPDTNDTPAA